MSAQNQGVLIVGVGNLLLGDEGLGIHVARRLQGMRDTLPAIVQVLEAGTALLDVVAEMARFEHVILVDAIHAGGKPGTIYRADGLEKILEQIEAVTPISLHELDLSQTLQMTRLLGFLPPQLSLLGAEPDRIDLTTELSPPAEQAAARIVSLLLQKLESNTGRARDSGLVACT